MRTLCADALQNLVARACERMGRCGPTPSTWPHRSSRPTCAGTSPTACSAWRNITRGGKGTPEAGGTTGGGRGAGVCCVGGRRHGPLARWWPASRARLRSPKARTRRYRPPSPRRTVTTWVGWRTLVTSSKMRGSSGWPWRTTPATGAGGRPGAGMDGRLSTNPIAVGVPGGAGPGILFDFSTSAAAAGKVRQLLLGGKDTPDGWLIDAIGSPTCDPAALLANRTDSRRPAVTAGLR